MVHYKNTWPIQTVSCDVRVFVVHLFVPSGGDHNRVDWRLLVEERIAKISNLRIVLPWPKSQPWCHPVDWFIRILLKRQEHTYLQLEQSSRPTDDRIWKRMIVDERGWKKMKEDEIGWKWMMEDERGWKRMKQDETWLKRMKGNERGGKGMKEDGRGRKSIKEDERGLKRMKEDWRGWKNLK